MKKNKAAAPLPAAAGNKAKKARTNALSEELPKGIGLCLIEYAAVKKPSPCMNCGGSIANGEVRLGNLATSHIFEGFQCRWLHLTCAINGGCGGIKRITQLKGWDRMGYDCSLEIREETGEVLEKKAEAALKNRMETFEATQEGE
jgi:hypothetical protein